MRKREMTLTLTVTVPATVGESEVEQAINRALDEGQETCNDWGKWLVGAVTITDVKRA